MDIEGLKRWHWIALGIILGVVVSLWQLFLHRTFGPRYDANVDRSLDQVMFERTVTSAPGPWEFVYGPLTVHPAEPDGKLWVTGYLARPDRGRNPDEPRRAYLFMAPTDVPFVPRIKPPNYAPSDTYTVLDYLEAVAPVVPDSKIEFRYAWWEEPPIKAAITTGLVTLLVGGLWPTALSAMTGGGFGASAAVRAERAARRAAKKAARHPRPTAPPPRRAASAGRSPRRRGPRRRRAGGRRARRRPPPRPRPAQALPRRILPRRKTRLPVGLLDASTKRIRPQRPQREDGGPRGRQKRYYEVPWPPNAAEHPDAHFTQSSLFVFALCSLSVCLCDLCGRLLSFFPSRLRV